MTKKVLADGFLEVSRQYFPDGSGAGMVVVKDFTTNTSMCLYPHEIEFLTLALKEILNFTPGES